MELHLALDLEIEDRGDGGNMERDLDLDSENVDQGDGKCSW